MPTLCKKISTRELLQLVKELPHGAQTVFNLYIIEGYNHKEIAQLLGISEGTSKWHLSEARKKLQQLLQKLATPLTENEMRALASDLFECMHPNITASGNPTFIEFRKEYVEKMFGKMMG